MKKIPKIAFLFHLEDELEKIHKFKGGLYAHLIAITLMNSIIDYDKTVHKYLLVACMEEDSARVGVFVKESSEGRFYNFKYGRYLTSDGIRYKNINEWLTNVKNFKNSENCYIIDLGAIF